MLVGGRALPHAMDKCPDKHAASRADAVAVEDARGTLVSVDVEGIGASSRCAVALSMELSTAAELEDHALAFSQS